MIVDNDPIEQQYAKLCEQFEQLRKLHALQEFQVHYAVRLHRLGLKRNQVECIRRDNFSIVELILKDGRKIPIHPPLYKPTP